MTRRGRLPFLGPRENAHGTHDTTNHVFGSYAMSQRLPNAKVTLGRGFDTPQPFFLLYSPKCLEAAFSKDHIRDSPIGSFEAHLSLTAIAQEGAEDQPWRFSILRLVPRVKCRWEKSLVRALSVR
jgi:hypothetical protein